MRRATWTLILALCLLAGCSKGEPPQPVPIPQVERPAPKPEPAPAPPSPPPPNEDRTIPLPPAGEIQGIIPALHWPKVGGPDETLIPLPTGLLLSYTGPLGRLPFVMTAWDTQGKARWTWRSTDVAVGKVSVAGDGETMAVVQKSGRVQILGVRDGQPTGKTAIDGLAPHVDVFWQAKGSTVERVMPNGDRRLFRIAADNVQVRAVPTGEAILDIEAGGKRSSCLMTTFGEIDGCFSFLAASPVVVNGRPFFYATEADGTITGYDRGDGPATATAPAPDSGGVELVPLDQDLDLRFTLLYPKGWKLAPTAMGDSVEIAKDDLTRIRVQTYQLRKEQPPTTLAEMQAQTESWAPGATIQQVAVPGTVSAFAVTFTRKQGESLVTGRALILYGKTHTESVEFTAPQAQFATWDPTFRRVQESYRHSNLGAIPLPGRP